MEIYTNAEKITILTEYADVSFETISCMTAINGYSSDTLADILYWRTGYTCFEDFVLSEVMEQ